MPDLPDLVRLVDAAADPWGALAALLASGAGVYALLPTGLFAGREHTTGTDPENDASPTREWTTRVDLGGLVRLCPEHVGEMLQRQSEINVSHVFAPWGDLMAIERGGPLHVTIDRLLAREQDLKPLKLRKPPKPVSVRDQERRSLGGDAFVSIRRASELLPGDEKRNRSALSESGITRVVQAEDAGGGRKTVLLGVRWRDVFDVFPTASEAAEADRLGLEREARSSVEAEPRRRRRPRKGGGFPLADLD